MLTAEGRRRLGELVVAEVAALRVLDGTGNRTTSEITGHRFEEDGSLVLQAEFDSSFANFEWREQQVVLKDDTVLDTDTQDLGRKVEGSVWSLEIGLLFGDSSRT